MPRAKSELKVPASDALEFEAIKSKPPKSWRGLKLIIFIIAFVSLIGSGWLVYGDILHGLMISRSKNVPLISAPEGPVKLRPDKPGGMQVPNRDKLVYERIRSGNAASETELVERLLPQSEKPVPMPWSGSKKKSDPSPPQGEVPIKPKSNILPNYPMDRVPALKDVTSIKPPPALSEDPTNTTALRPRTLNNKIAPLSRQKKREINSNPILAPEIINKNNSVIREKVAKIRAAPALAKNKIQSKSSSSKVSSNSPNRIYRIQVAAARTPKQARLEWERIRRKHLDLLGDLGLTVMKADLGPKKGVFYRLRIGPLENENSARALCKKLSKRKLGCLVVRPGH